MQDYILYHIRTAVKSSPFPYIKTRVKKYDHGIGKIWIFKDMVAKITNVRNDKLGG